MNSPKNTVLKNRKLALINGGLGRIAFLPKKSHHFVRASLQYLTKTDASFGVFDLDQFAISVFVKRATVSGSETHTICGQQNIAGTGVCFLLRFINDKLNFSVSSDGTSLDGVVETTGTYTSTETWYHILAIYDVNNATASQKMRVFINGSEPARSYTEPTLSANDSGAAIRIGKNGLNSAGGEFDGLIYGWNFFSGFVPTVDQVSRQGITPVSPIRFLSLHSSLDARTIVSDYVQGGDWINVGSVTLNDDTPFRLDGIVDGLD